MKALKILVLLLIAAVIIVVGGAAAFVAFSDPNDFKDLIAEKVRDQTGRELTLEGPLEWAFWPKLRLKAGPLSLSNAPGFGDEPMFAADEIQVAVATLPLMRERIEMDTIKLHGVVVNLARNAAGVTNWQDLAGGDGETEPYDGGLASFVLGGVDIKDARITWSDAATDPLPPAPDINSRGTRGATNAIQAPREPRSLSRRLRRRSRADRTPTPWPARASRRREPARPRAWSERERSRLHCEARAR